MEYLKLLLYVEIILKHSVCLEITLHVKAVLSHCGFTLSSPAFVFRLIIIVSLTIPSYILVCSTFMCFFSEYSYMYMLLAFAKFPGFSV